MSVKAQHLWEQVWCRYSKGPQVLLPFLQSSIPFLLESRAKLNASSPDVPFSLARSNPLPYQYDRYVVERSRPVACPILQCLSSLCNISALAVEYVEGLCTIRVVDVGPRRQPNPPVRAALSIASCNSGVLHLPVLWYCMMFLTALPHMANESPTLADSDMSSPAYRVRFCTFLAASCPTRRPYVGSMWLLPVCGRTDCPA